MKNYTLILVFVSIALAFACGVFFPQEMIATKWIGQLFINALKVIVLPLIFCAIVSAITSMGSLKRLGTIGIYTVCYVLLSVSLAVIIGLALLNFFKPGVGVSSHLILASAQPHDFHPLPFSDYILSLFPANIVDAAAKYEIMPIVFFSIVFSMACLSIEETTKPVIAFFAGLRDILVKMIMWLMVLTPIGLFSLLGNAIAEASTEHLLVQSLRGMFMFIIIFLIGLILQITWQTLLLTFVTGKNPFKFISTASRAIMTGFVTSSSMATLPITLHVAKQQEINDEVSRFVLPFATTINLAGTAMYEAVSALFFCQILGMHLSILTQIGVFVTAILAGMGATGIPEGGIITMVMVLRNVNVPTSAIGILLPFDRLLDRFRTMTNVWGDLVCANMVDHFQKKHKKSKDKKIKRVSDLSKKCRQSAI